MEPSELIDVQLACAWPERSHIHKARVQRGTTAAELLVRSRVLERFPDLGVNPPLAVFGQKIDASYVLAPGDRVEVLRPLRHDPKETRRLRAARATSSKRKRN